MATITWLDSVEPTFYKKIFKFDIFSVNKQRTLLQAFLDHFNLLFQLARHQDSESQQGESQRIFCQKLRRRTFLNALNTKCIVGIGLGSSIHEWTKVIDIINDYKLSSQLRTNLLIVNVTISANIVIFCSHVPSRGIFWWNLYISLCTNLYHVHDFLFLFSYKLSCVIISIITTACLYTWLLQLFNCVHTPYWAISVNTLRWLVQ